MPNEYSYRNLILWQKAQELTLEIVKLIVSMPKTSVNDIISRQVVRSASSIAANVAEGHGRYAPRGHAYHLSIAKGSACETDSWLDLLRRSGAITAEQEGPLQATCQELIAMLTSKIRDLEKLSVHKVREERAEYDPAGRGTPAPEQ